MRHSKIKKTGIIISRGSDPKKMLPLEIHPNNSGIYNNNTGLLKTLQINYLFLKLILII